MQTIYENFLTYSLLLLGIFMNSLINEYRVDESKFESNISHAESNYTGTKVHIDIKSATCIFALRKGRVTLNISDKPHIFVSSTYRVIKNINEFFKNDYPESVTKNISIFTKDDWLTNLCWISNTKNTSISRDFLIANSYASLNEDSEFWEIFKKKLNTLEKQGKITEEGLNAIRHEKDFKYCVEEHFVSTRDLKEDDISNIIDKAKKKIHETYEKDIKQLKESNKDIKENIKTKSNKLGRIFTIAFTVIVVALIFTVSYMKHNWLLGIILSLSGFFGVTYKYKKIEIFISKKIYDYFYNLQ